MKVWTVLHEVSDTCGDASVDGVFTTRDAALEAARFEAENFADDKHPIQGVEDSVWIEGDDDDYKHVWTVQGHELVLPPANPRCR